MKKIIILFIYAIMFFQGNISFAQTLNENFNNATCGGNSAFNNGCVPNWEETQLSPTIAGFGNNPYAWMWSNTASGEGIVTHANYFNFVAGQTYNVSFRLRTDDRNTNDSAAQQNGRVFLVATNSTGSVTNNPTGDIIWNNSIGGTYYQNWQTITTTFTPTTNKSQLWIYPYWNTSNGNQVEMSIDDIVIAPCSAADEIINFHFQHTNSVEDTTFSVCEDVFLDGSATLNTGNYYMDLWKVNSNGTVNWLSGNGWTQGQPNLVNITQTFANNTNNPITFQNGVTYRVKLAVNSSCGWRELTHDFTLEGSISSLFTIDDYDCHDGVYDVTVTAQDTLPVQWWRVYETSVEGQTGDSVTIGSASSIQGGITTTFTNLDPNKFYYIKHGVWTANCSWQETRTPLDRDCCIDTPQIEPYWDYCSSENVCDLDTWPIRVVDANGTPVTGADGVQFSWVSSNGGSSSSDVVYTVAFEEWTLTLTYPDGCIYTRTYKKECCQENIHIEIDKCPTSKTVINLEKQIQNERSNLSDVLYAKYINAIKNYKERIDNPKIKCNPCDNGTVVMKIVDANGNLITNAISIIWGDGLFSGSNVRMGDVNVTYTVTVIVPVNGGNDSCIYTDTFIYNCPTELPVIGKNGNKETNKIVNTTEQFKEVSITPNPTKGEMTFRIMANINTEVNVTIYDAYGTLIKSFVKQVISDKASSISWDGSNLKKGVYFVNFRTKEETIYKQVIVK